MSNNAYEALPCDTLKDIFRNYRQCHVNQESISNTGVIIEDGIAEFCFIKEKDIILKTKNESIRLPQAFSFGKVELPYRFVIPTKMTYFTIKIEPWVTNFFFDGIENGIKDLSKTIYKDILDLHEAIFKLKDFKKQVAIVEDYFLRQALPNLEDYQISKQICEIINEHQGNIKIRKLMSYFNYSRQKLNQVFLKQTQNSIKEFAVYVRLRSIMAYHLDHPEESLTSIAYKFGYYDQSHFIKDMKNITNMSPSEFTNKTNMFFKQLKNRA